ncbi:MAG: oligosaccharide flippase family protein [Planctomycetes bacterium]|nr:oligosaccharide flippase family protein [Planctomycetota bacterium]
MRFLEQTSLLFANRLAAAGLAIVIGALSARILTPAELGAMVAVVASVALLMRMASLGLGQSAQYFGARERSDETSFGNSLLVCALPLAIVPAVVLTLAERFAGSWVVGADSNARVIFAILMYGIPLSMIHFIASLYSLGRREMRDYMLLSLLPMFASVFVLGYAKLMNLGLQAVIWAWMTQYVVSFAIGLMVLSKKGVHTPVRPLAAAKRLYGYGGRSYLVALAAFAATRLGLVIGVWYTSDAEMGYFAVSRNFADVLLLLYGAVGPLVFSYVSGMTTPDEYHPFIGRVCRVSILAFSGIALLIGCAAPLGVPFVFGADYAGQHVIVWLLLPGLVVSAIQRSLENYLYGRNKQSWLAYSHALSIVLLCAFVALLAPRWGARGLALSTTLSCLGSFAFTAIVAFVTDGLNPVSLVWPRMSDFRLVSHRIQCLGTRVYGRQTD